MSDNQNRTYPVLPAETERRLEAIRMVSKGDGGYFDDPRCPYPWLKTFVVGGEGGGREKRRRVEAEEGADPIDEMLQDLQDMISSMNDFEDEIANSETNERIQFIKAKTQLIERWTSLKGELLDKRAIAAFQRIVITLLEEMLDTDQRQEFKRRIKEKLG